MADEQAEAFSVETELQRLMELSLRAPNPPPRFTELYMSSARRAMASMFLASPDTRHLNTIRQPRFMMLQVLDGRGSQRQPVQDLLLRKVTVSYGDQEQSYGYFPDHDRFRKDFYPLIAEPPYAANPAKDSHRFLEVKRREWMGHLRMWLAKMGRLEIATTGQPPRTFTDAFATARRQVWCDATGHPPAEYATRGGKEEVAALLAKAARGAYRTDPWGRIWIPLPVNQDCTVTIAFRETMLVAQTSSHRAAKSLEVLRHEDAWHCVPEGERPDAPSAHEGETDADGAYAYKPDLSVEIEAPNNNFEQTAYGMLWCQPVWYEHTTGGNAAELEKQIVPDPVGARPTMMIPSVIRGASGPHYGECGFPRTLGTAYPTTHYGAPPNQKWYRVEKWGKEPESESEYQTEAEARAASDITVSPPTTYRQVGGKWRVYEVLKYSGPFRSQNRARSAKYHAGHDLAGRTEVSPVYALTGGKVSSKSGHSLVIVASRNGVTFTHGYQHLHSHAKGIMRGTIVQAGSIIATMGRKGNIDKGDPTNNPTHCHFYLKRRASAHTERHQMAYGTPPRSDGFFSHEPGARRGPWHELRGGDRPHVELTEENLACIPNNATTFHLLPCAGETHPKLVFSGTTSTVHPNACKNLPLALRAKGAKKKEQNLVRNLCWASTINRCPWEDMTTSKQLSRYYEFRFNGYELSLVSTGRTERLPIASAAMDETVLKTWRAYSGEPVKGSPLDDDDDDEDADAAPSHAKRFPLTNAAQARRDEGPIPEGDWWINVSEMIDVSDVSLSYRAWGHYAVPIHPFRKTITTIIEDGEATPEREGFYIHGGAAWGDAGGIDLREQDKDFQRYLKKDPDGRIKFKLTVKYGEPFVEAFDESY